MKIIKQSILDAITQRVTFLEINALSDDVKSISVVPKCYK